MQAGRQPKKYSGEHGDTAKKEQHGKVDPCVTQVGRTPQQSFRNGRDQQIDAPLGADQSNGGAGEREQQAFGQQLREQASSARPQRRSHGKFLAPPDRARHHQVGNVGARDQQDKSHGS